MRKQKKHKSIFKKPLTRAELEGMAAYGLSRELQPHQRLAFAKAFHAGISEGEGDLSYPQALAKKTQGFLTSEDRKLARELTDELMALVEESKLRYGREMVTAAEAVTFIEDGEMRELARKNLLAMLVDGLIGLVGESKSLTDAQHKELSAFFRDMVELSIFYRDLDHIENVNEQPLIISGRIPNERSARELFDFTYECFVRYINEKITAEDATKSADDWKHDPTKYLLLSRVLVFLHDVMIDHTNLITLEQHDEIKDYIGYLTYSYIAYTTLPDAGKTKLKAQDVWDAYPVFVQEHYGENQPCMASQAEEVAKEFYDWLINNSDYGFHAVEDQSDAEKWLHKIVELCVTRRIMQYKYILYEYHGKDTFADSETRDKVVAYARAHPESIGQ